jgi:hypothetical protein
VGFASYDDFQDHTHVFDTKVKIPALLHVHIESRVEDLRFYKLSHINEFAMNTFYLYPALDTLNLVQPAFDQLKPFFEKDDSGLLSKIENIAILDFNEGVAGFLYGAKLREVTLTCKEECAASQERYRACECQASSFIEFAELGDDEKKQFSRDERLDDLKEWEVEFKRKWKMYGDLPCPVVRSMAICSDSRGYWSRINKYDAECFRWLKQQMGNDSEDGLDEILEDEKSRRHRLAKTMGRKWFSSR